MPPLGRGLPYAARRAAVDPMDVLAGALLAESLGDRLRAARQAVDKTVREVAEVAGCAPSTWSAVETGRRGASAQMEARMRAAVGLEAVQVAEGTLPLQPLVFRATRLLDRAVHDSPGGRRAVARLTWALDGVEAVLAPRVGK